MSRSVAVPPMTDEARAGAIPASLFSHLVEATEQALLIADQDGRIVFASQIARNWIETKGLGEWYGLNLFGDLLQVSPKDIPSVDGTPVQAGRVDIERDTLKFSVNLTRVPESDWVMARVEAPVDIPAAEAATQITVQELLQEREITYRNLLAAYLKLQEVNRQKTVFLASAAHELKTPLAVIKGYYDLLLTSSLGRLTEKQRDILEESKESCERLVRLVSMFLNYSALESGKLVLQLRENDMRDCLDELAKRWLEAFQRKGVRLEATFDPSIPNFRFDYQKVQQAAANLLDNALKHTPAGGSVTLRALPHFWERRVVEASPSQERRRFRLPRPNSVEVSVADTGPGIAPEHHQEIFEDFVRVDRNTTGMGLGLAIAKRLVQAHRGKIWVESEPVTGSRFTFLLPMDQS